MTATLDTNQIEDIYPLTPTQRGMLFHTLYAPDSDMYFQQESFLLEGQLDRAAFARAWQHVLDRHSVLRTAIVWEGLDQPVQVVFRQVQVPLEQLDWRDVPQNQVPQRLADLAQAERTRGFNPVEAPLMRLALIQVADDAYHFVWSRHHLLLDGWSVALLLQEVGRSYAALRQNRPPNLEHPRPYRAYLAWLQQQSAPQAEAFWRAELAGFRQATPLAVDHPPIEPGRERYHEQQAHIPAERVAALQSWARAQRLTLNTVLQGAWALLLGRYSGANDVLFGATSASRPTSIAGIESVVGLFINTLPVRVRVDPDAALVPWLQRLQAHQSEARQYEYSSLADVQRWSEAPRGAPLFESLLVFENIPRAQLAADLAGDLSIRSLSTFESTNYPLNLVVVPGDGLALRLIYNTDRFDEAAITRMLGHLQTMLDAMLADGTQHLADVPLLTAAERQQLLPLVEPVRAPDTISQRFAMQAAHSPDAVALVSGDQRLTYRELDQQANQLAHYLQSLQLAPGARVGLCLDRSAELAIGLLGILKAGVACVPFDLADPASYLARQIASTSVAAIVTGARQADALAATRDAAGTVPLVTLDPALLADQPTADPAEVASDKLALVFASPAGNTEVEHGALMQRMDLLQRGLALSDADSVRLDPALGLATFAWEICWPLLHGARLILAPADGQKQRASVAHVTAATLADMLDAPTDSGALDSLRAVLYSGATLPADTRERFVGRFRCGLYHLYAPPEAGPQIIAQHHPADQNTSVDGQKTQPFAYVLDAAAQPVPIGVFGEVVLPDPGLAREKAGTSPQFGKNVYSTDPNARWFRTGDRGRWLGDGTLELAPLAGRQLWRGDQRVDLDQIEAALLGDPTIEQCAVLARMLPNGVLALVAYVVANGAFTPDRLRDHLTPQLPTALRPDAMIPLVRLPLTADGLVDAAALTSTVLIDAALAQEWERQIQTVPTIAQAAVLVQDTAVRPAPLHLSDLLPEWRPTAESDAPAQPTTAPGPQSGAPRPAIASGPPLHVPPDAPRTLTEALLRTAAAHPATEIVYVQSDGTALRQTYAALLDQATRILAGLQAAGLVPGDQVILQIERLDQHLPAFWACVLGGIAPVTVAVAPSYDDRNAVVNKLYNIWELLEHPPIITSEHLVGPLRGLGAILPMPNPQLLSVDALRVHAPSTAIHQPDPRDVVFFQLTSGSTGIPKCIQETHHGVIAHIHASVQINGYTADDITLNWLPMDHVVPLLMFHVKDVYLGCQQVQARTDMILSDPLRWLDLIEQHRVTSTWSPNFGYKLLADRMTKAATRRWDLSSIRCFINAGEQVTSPVVREFLQAVAPFGAAQQTILPAYGMAELCTAMVYGSNFSLDTSVNYFDKGSLYGTLAPSTADDTGAVNFVESGPPTPGVSIRIVDTANRLRDEGVIGRLQVQGEVVTPGYLRNPAANQEAFTDDGWFYTGDLGFIRDGRLTITGREKEVIIINGANYYCYEIEDIVNQLPGVEATYVAAVAVDDPRSGTEGVAIFFTPTTDVVADHLDVIKQTRARMVTSLGLNPLHVVPVPKAAFPKTTSGKIQRTQLKTGLLNGQFQDTLKQLDLALENANTLHDWFYRKVWRPAAPRTNAPQVGVGPALVFTDGDGLGAALCDRLRAMNRACVAVEAGDDFAKLDPAHYRINPGDPAHYRALLEAVAHEHGPVGQIMHLWAYAAPSATPAGPAAIERAQELGAYSVLFLTQALAQVQAARPVRLSVVASGVQRVVPDDAVAYEHAPVLGLIKTIAQEFLWLNCCHIDLPYDRNDANVARLLDEIAQVHKEREVVFRGDQRLVARLEPADLPQQPTRALPFVRNGVYLVSGGTGGVAATLVTYLREQHDARLILVGRTAPDQLGAAWQRLEQLGEVVYEAADITDVAALRVIAVRAETRWKRPLDGVIHLAGAYHERLIGEETREHVAEILRPKLLGTWALHQLVADRPDALFLSFSSINSFFGGFSVGAYAAANSFLESFAHYQRQVGGRQIFCYAWSMWDNVGISRAIEMKTLAHARGYAAISARQGLLSLLAGLAHGQAELLIGLDRSRPQIGRLVEMGAPQAQQLVGYFASPDGAAAAEALARLEVFDRFRARSMCQFVQLPALPMAADGTIDRQALMFAGSAHVASEEVYVAPQTDLERTIATIWQETLRVDKVGLHDNFFDLGGQSLLMVQVQGKLRATLGRDISMVDMFRYPTIGALARHLGAAPPTADPTRQAQDRRQKQQTAMAQQKQRAQNRRQRGE